MHHVRDVAGLPRRPGLRRAGDPRRARQARRAGSGAGLRLLDVARLRLLGPERVTARGYAARERDLARLKAEHQMTHDLVDAVPGAVGHRA